jgi:hypothetical protein
MKIIKWLIANQKQVASGAALFLLVICYLQQKQLAKLRNEPKIEVYTGGDIERGRIIDSLQNKIDSLYNENFPCQVELNRYQMAYEIFMERNPKAAQQYGTIISEETE